MPLARKTVTGTSCLRTCSRKVSWRACGCAAAMIGLPGRPHTCWPTVPLSAQRPTPEHHSARMPCTENGSRVLVTNERTGKSVVVRINDRGPYAHGRLIDLSKAAAQAVGISGVGKVKLTRL